MFIDINIHVSKDLGIRKMFSYIVLCLSVSFYDKGDWRINCTYLI
jgi:hypothetical protein